MERLHIAFFGATNSGKSTLVNALAGQEVSLVSPVPGTTTDPVRKAIEIPGLGPCVLIDTAGYDDRSPLGPDRQRLTASIIDTTDVAVICVGTGIGTQNRKDMTPEGECSAYPIPNTSTNFSGVGPGSRTQDRNDMTPEGECPAYLNPGLSSLIKLLKYNDIPVVTYTWGESIEKLIGRIAEVAPKEEPRLLTGGLVKAGDSVILVMPQDSEAPMGRLILPQVQVLRELLDRGCNALCCQPEGLRKALESIPKPALVITDSQVFKAVNDTLPREVPLTSFSVLLAGAKGDIETYVEGAKAIDALKTGDRVLIAEACTHVPNTEDIGRVKLPALLRKKVFERMGTFDGHFVPIPSGEEGDGHVSGAFCAKPPTLQVDIAAGNDFPSDLSPYALIIQCGGCVATERLIRTRIKKALRAGVPITNYGIALAHLQGILSRISLP